MADTIETTLPKAPGVKIIRKADEAAWRDGYRLLAEAKRIYESERARGYAEGREAGVAEASRLVVETAANVERYVSTLDEQVGQLAMDIVRRVLGEFDQTDLVARAAANALADFKREKALKITVHPNAEQHVLQVLSRQGEREVTIQVETDPAVDENACLIASEFAVVEATVETQLAAISKALGLSNGRAVQ
jgi:type III secretion protein L